MLHADTSIQRHVKVRGTASPFNGDIVYWSQRLRQHPLTSGRIAILPEDLEFLIDQDADLERRLADETPAADLAHPRGAAVWEALRRCWPRVRRGERRLVHGDYWPGNTVWRRGRLIGIVDWEVARRSRPGRRLLPP